MLSSDLDRLTPVQRLIVERAYVRHGIGRRRRLRNWGQVIDRCESLLLGHGRDFLRRALESSLQSRAQALEKKGEPAASAPAGRRDATKGTHPRR